MRVGFLQFSPEFGKVETNFKRFLNFIDNINLDLIVLPELAFTGYLFKSREEAFSFAEDPEDGEIFCSLLEFSYKRSMIIVYGFPEKRGNRLYNSAACLLPDGNYYIYRKIHLFDREKEIFDRGDEKPKVIRWGGIKFGIMICYDWAFPEVARILSLKGAQILIHPSNLILPYGEEAMRVRSMENRVFSITSNRIGTERRGGMELTFRGGSQIVSPKGKILSKGSRDKEEIKIVEIDPKEAEDKNLTERTHLFCDRRPDLYVDLCT
jgi:predicted amidohydrolase